MQSSELAQVPLEAIHWHRVVLANYDEFRSYSKQWSPSRRALQTTTLTRFLNVVAYERLVIVSTKSLTSLDLRIDFLPVVQRLCMQRPEPTGRLYDAFLRDMARQCVSPSDFYLPWQMTQFHKRFERQRTKKLQKQFFSERIIYVRPNDAINGLVKCVFDMMCQVQDVQSLVPIGNSGFAKVQQRQEEERQGNSSGGSADGRNSTTVADYCNKRNANLSCFAPKCDFKQAVNVASTMSFVSSSAIVSYSPFSTSLAQGASLARVSRTLQKPSVGNGNPSSSTFIPSTAAFSFENEDRSSSQRFCIYYPYFGDEGNKKKRIQDEEEEKKRKGEEDDEEDEDDDGIIIPPYPAKKRRKLQHSLRSRRRLFEPWWQNRCHLIAHLKPTYRYLLFSVLHNPALLYTVYSSLVEQNEYCNSRVLTSVVRDPTELPTSAMTVEGGERIRTRVSRSLSQETSFERREANVATISSSTTIDLPIHSLQQIENAERRAFQIEDEDEEDEEFIPEEEDDEDEDEFIEDFDEDGEYVEDLGDFDEDDFDEDDFDEDDDDSFEEGEFRENEYDPTFIDRVGAMENLQDIDFHLNPNDAEDIEDEDYDDDDGPTGENLSKTLSWINRGVPNAIPSSLIEDDDEHEPYFVKTQRYRDFKNHLQMFGFDLKREHKRGDKPVPSEKAVEYLDPFTGVARLKQSFSTRVPFNTIEYLPSHGPGFDDATSLPYVHVQVSLEDRALLTFCDRIHNDIVTKNSNATEKSSPKEKEVDHEAPATISLNDFARGFRPAQRSLLSQGEQVGNGRIVGQGRRGRITNDPERNLQPLFQRVEDWVWRVIANSPDNINFDISVLQSATNRRPLPQPPSNHPPPPPPPPPPSFPPFQASSSNSNTVDNETVSAAAAYIVEAFLSGAQRPLSAAAAAAASDAIQFRVNGERAMQQSASAGVDMSDQEESRRNEWRRQAGERQAAEVHIATPTVQPVMQRTMVVEKKKIAAETLQQAITKMTECSTHLLRRYDLTMESLWKEQKETAQLLFSLIQTLMLFVDTHAPLRLMLTEQERLEFRVQGGAATKFSDVGLLDHAAMSLLSQRFYEFYLNRIQPAIFRHSSATSAQPLTASTVYLRNMIGKFHYETAWIERDLRFIDQQRERVRSATQRLNLVLERYAKVEKEEEERSTEDQCCICLENVRDAESVALYPCGHICCWQCHAETNTEEYDPHDENDDPVGIAQSGLRCFTCRYLLQHGEQVRRVCLGRKEEGKDGEEGSKDMDIVADSPVILSAVSSTPLPVSSSILSSASSTRAATEPFISASSTTTTTFTGIARPNPIPFSAVPNTSLPPASILKSDTPKVNDSPENTGFMSSRFERVKVYPERQRKEEEGEEDEEEEEELDQKKEEKEKKSVPLLVPDSYWQRKGVGKDDGAENALEKARKDVVYLKTVPVYDAIVSAIEKTDEKSINIGVVSSHAALLHELATLLRLYNALSTSNRVHIILKPNFETISEHQKMRSRGFGEGRIGQKKGKIAAFVFLYHLDTFQHPQHFEIVTLPPENSLHQLMFVESVCIRTVDDRRSNVLASQIEQRVISRVANEFSRNKVQITRFIVSGSIDEYVYLQTRW